MNPFGRVLISLALLLALLNCTPAAEVGGAEATQGDERTELPAEVPEWAVSHLAPEVLSPWNRTDVRFRPNESATLEPDEVERTHRLRAAADAISACMGDLRMEYVLDLRHHGDAACLGDALGDVDPAEAYHLLARWEDSVLRELFAVRRDRTCLDRNATSNLSGLVGCSGGAPSPSPSNQPEQLDPFSD